MPSATLEHPDRRRPGVAGTLTEPALKATDALLRALNAPEV